MTWSSKLTSQIIQMMNIKSPIRTITRKSVYMVAELRNGTEDCSAVTKATTATAVALDTNSFMVVAAYPLSLLALKPSSKFGVDSVVDWMQWFRGPHWYWRSRSCLPCHQLEAGASNARMTYRRVAG